jgi:hypothetical protein
MPFLVPFNKFIGGPKDAAEWDKEKVIPHELRHTRDMFVQMASANARKRDGNVAARSKHGVAPLGARR